MAAGSCGFVFFQRYISAAEFLDCAADAGDAGNRIADSAFTDIMCCRELHCVCSEPETAGKNLYTVVYSARDGGGVEYAGYFSYFFMFRALDCMNKIGGTALVFPIVIGVNITAFSLYSRFRLRERYTPLTLCSLLLCVSGIIVLTLK